MIPAVLATAISGCNSELNEEVNFSSVSWMMIKICTPHPKYATWIWPFPQDAIAETARGHALIELIKHRGNQLRQHSAVINRGYGNDVQDDGFSSILIAFWFYST
jgi:hypothetical protein